MNSLSSIGKTDINLFESVEKHTSQNTLLIHKVGVCFGAFCIVQGTLLGLGAITMLKKTEKKPELSARCKSFTINIIASLTMVGVGYKLMK